MYPVSHVGRRAFILAALFVFSLTHIQGQDSAAITTDYKVSPQDVLTISVVGEKDLTQECRVSTSGTITYAWLSNVEVAGKTPPQIEQELRTALDKDYLVEPTVIVALKEYRAREVNVVGQVNKPGPVTIPPERPMTIIEAITRAQGLTLRGNRSKIEFTRRGKKQTLRWEDLDKITDPTKQIYVEPGDVIEIGEKIL
jgi:protein involved in polysaccharide export with SLBB domain